MADERDDEQLGGNESTGEQTIGQESDRNEYGAEGQPRMANQGAEGSFGGQSNGSQSGSADANGSSIAGGASDGTGGQPIGGNDSNTGSGTTLTQAADFQGQSSSGQPRSSGSDGFIGSQGGGSDDYLQERDRSNNPSSSEATDGSDFARQGRGALEDDSDEESDGSGGGSF